MAEEEKKEDVRKEGGVEMGRGEMAGGDAPAPQGEEAGRDGPAPQEDAAPKERGTTPPRPEKRDWVAEAAEAFFPKVKGRDPATDPVGAIARMFGQRASEGLKARCREEGKTAERCWAFVRAVARKVLGGRDGHIEPERVYAVAMHWFQDVPADWDKVGAAEAARPEKKAPRAEKGRGATAPRPERRGATPPRPKREAPRPKSGQGMFDFLAGEE